MAFFFTTNKHNQGPIMTNHDQSPTWQLHPIWETQQGIQGHHAIVRKESGKIIEIPQENHGGMKLYPLVNVDITMFYIWFISPCEKLGKLIINSNFQQQIVKLPEGMGGSNISGVIKHLMGKSTMTPAGHVQCPSPRSPCHSQIGL